MISADPPTRLPVSRLSVTSLNLLARCPERWRRRYLEREYEPTNGAALLGKSVGAAETQHYGYVIETGVGLGLEAVQDEFSATWDYSVGDEEINWGTDKPGKLKDEGFKVVERMHTQIAPTVKPVSVERQFVLQWPGLDWTLEGYLDVEESLRVRDMKTRSAKRGRMSQAEADSDLQPASYLYAREAEGNPATQGFAFDTAVRAKLPYAETVHTNRTPLQLDAFEERVLNAASEIAFRTEYDKWTGAVPGTWWCSNRFCGYYSSCRWGGLK